VVVVVGRVVVVVAGTVVGTATTWKWTLVFDAGAAVCA
jgi:hypothetical protein